MIPKKAVILAAGKGSRLMPLTAEIPKALVRVQGRPILLWEIQGLHRLGVEEILVLTGHRSERIESLLGPSFQGTTLRYLFNPFYETASNASTLGLAEEFLKGGGLIVEGDVVWGETFQRALQKGLESSSPPVTWAALPFLDGMDGSLLVSDHSLKVHSMGIRKSGSPLPEGGLWKSSGLVNLSSQGSLAFFPLLKEDPARTPNTTTWSSRRTSPLFPYRFSLSRGGLDGDRSPEDLKVAEMSLYEAHRRCRRRDGRSPQSGLKGDPLESAYMPHSNFLAARGRTGLVKTCYPGLPVESAVANMGILGYDPYRFDPTGRASFEALARGIPLETGDIALRCNLISLDSQGAILDFTSRQIPDGEALSLISHLSTDLRESKSTRGRATGTS